MHLKYQKSLFRHIRSAFGELLLRIGVLVAVLAIIAFLAACGS